MSVHPLKVCGAACVAQLESQSLQVHASYCFVIPCLNMFVYFLGCKLQMQSFDLSVTCAKRDKPARWIVEDLGRTFDRMSTV